MQKKYVLITGASRGIGRACALAFAGAGYHVFLNSRRPAEALSLLREEILKQGGSCTCVPGDVSSAAQVSQIFEIIRTHCPALDVLVNNAGISHFGLLSDMSDEEWQKILNTNQNKISLSMKDVEDLTQEREEEKVSAEKYSSREEATTSLGDLLKNLKL